MFDVDVDVDNMILLFIAGYDSYRRRVIVDLLVHRQVRSASTDEKGFFPSTTHYSNPTMNNPPRIRFVLYYCPGEH